MSENQTTHTPLWRWSELSEGLTGTTSPAGPDVQRVAIDSRLCSPGDLFIALPGDPGPRFNPSYRSAVDGHDFVTAAAKAGAVAAMVHKSSPDIPGSDHLPEEFRLLRVAETYAGLWDLGALARARLSGDVVGITGSSGKTTAKTFIAAALSGYAPPGSLNNHIGVPLSLANAPPQAHSCVFEIGTNHPGEIEPLAQMVDPHVAVLLNVHSAHIENFPDWEALREEKTNIFNILRDKSKAISEDVLNMGFGLTFGTSEHADARVLDVQGDMAKLSVLGRTLDARVPGGGLHRALTVAATLLVLHLLQRDLGSGCELSPGLVPDGRGNIYDIGETRIVDESYNANPDSMKAALTSFSEQNQGVKTIAVIGEMLELGTLSEQAHLELATSLAQFDAVFCVGEALRPLAMAEGYAWYAQADAAMAEVVSAANAPRNSLIVKGSNRVFWAENFVSKLLECLQSV